MACSTPITWSRPPLADRDARVALLAHFFEQRLDRRRALDREDAARAAPSRRARGCARAGRRCRAGGRCRRGSRRTRAPRRRAARAPRASAMAWPDRCASTPKRRTSALPAPFITTSAGRKTRPKTSSGPAHRERDRAGPIERERLRRELADDDVQERDRREARSRPRSSARAAASRCRPPRARAASSDATAGSPIQPRPRLASVMPSCVAAIASSSRSTARHRGGGAALALAHPELELRAPHRDQRELGRDEVRVGEHQQRDADQRDQREADAGSSSSLTPAFADSSARRPARSSTNCFATRPERLERSSAKRSASRVQLARAAVAMPALRRVALDDAQIGRLVEAVEAEHETEAVGERELLLERLAEVQLARLVEPRLAVVAQRAAGSDGGGCWSRRCGRSRASSRRCPRARP